MSFTGELPVAFNILSDRLKFLVEGAYSARSPTNSGPCVTSTG